MGGWHESLRQDYVFYNPSRVIVSDPVDVGERIECTFVYHVHSIGPVFNRSNYGVRFAVTEDDLDNCPAVAYVWGSDAPSYAQYIAGQLEFADPLGKAGLQGLAVRNLQHSVTRLRVIANSYGEIISLESGAQ